MPVGHPVIAIAEDPFIRKFLGDLLQKHGYRVIGGDAVRTLELIKSGTELVDVVITNTPGTFASVAKKVSLLYIAAAPDPDAGLPFPAFRAMTKPFHPQQLLAAIEELAGALAK